MFWKRRRNLHNTGIDFDEILMDSKNIQAFDTQQFEGRIEHPIRKSALVTLASFFVLALVVFAVRLHALQLKEGETYFDLSERNSLDGEIIFADRGVIFDRNGVELAWNERTEDMAEFDFSHRTYITSPGHSLLLGYIAYPQKDKKGFYWKTYFEGLDGIEKRYDDTLNGINGSKLVEENVMGEIISQNIVNEPDHGANLKLSIDSRLQTSMFTSIKTLAEEIGYVGGAGAMMDIKTGELIVATSYPEYDSKVLSEGDNRELINGFISDPKKPFLNRLVGGLYSPGSTIKPFVALGALHEGLINATTHIYSSGEIRVPNPYNKELFTVFRDWKEGGHGYADVTKAIAESVNTFFYAIGGGYEDQEGLGISRIEKYVKLFAIDQPTGVDILSETRGVVPGPDWKKKTFEDGVWRLGDTYNTSIGQYGFQATPIEMLRGIAAIGNGGTLLVPHVAIDISPSAATVAEHFDLSDYELVREGMREVVTSGTGQVLNVGYIDIAAKTGSAQTGRDNQYINSWVVGFFPYEEPKYAFVVLMERGPSEATRSASFAARGFFDAINQSAPEYFGGEPIVPVESEAVIPIKVEENIEASS